MKPTSGKSACEASPRGAEGDQKKSPPKWRAFSTSANDDVLELPGVVVVDVLGKQHFAIVEWGPARVFADHRAEIRTLHLKAAAEVDFVGLHDSGLRIFERPHHSGQYRAGDLQAGRVLIRRD